MDTKLQELGARVREARSRLDLNQNELAEKDGGLSALFWQLILL